MLSNGRSAVKTIAFSLIFLVSIVLFAGLSGHAQAARKVAISSVFGQVDVAMVIIFHPLMDFYYPKEKLFTYEFDRKTTVEALNKEFSRRYEARRKAIEEAKQKIKQMQESIAKFHSQKMLKREECRRNLNNIKAAMNIALSKVTDAKAIEKLEKEYHEKILAEERKYSDIARQIGNKLESIGEMYELEKSRVRVATFADADRQMDYFRQITREVEDAIYKAAENMKVSIVFNGTSIRRRTRETRKTYTESWKRVNLDDPYTRFGSVSLNANDFLMKGEQKYSSRLNKLESYISRFEGSAVLEDLFLLGGTDLTPEVIRILHKQHGYSDSEIAEIIKSFEKITSSENEDSEGREGGK